MAHVELEALLAQVASCPTFNLSLQGIGMLRQGRFVLVNDRACTILGRAQDDLLARTALQVGEMIHPLDRERARPHFQLPSAVDQPPDPLELRIIGPDGTERWIELFSGPLSVSGDVLSHCVFNDISARKLSDARYRLLAEHVTDVIWTADLDLRFTYLSPSQEQLTGYSPEEAMSLTLDRLLTPASLEVAMQAIAEALRSDGPRPTRNLDLEQVRKDGSTGWVEIRPTLLRDADGRPTGILGVTRDVTERRQLQAGMVQADRLASMGMLAAGVAHEINNPLAYVLYGLESLVEDLPTLELERLLEPATVSDISGRLTDALEGTRRIQEIARGLGTLSRVEQTEVGPVDVVQAVEHAVNMVHNEIKHRARLLLDLAPVPRIIATDGKLAQVVLNLLLNAAHAIPQGNSADNEIQVRTWAEAGRVYIEVSDTGPGVPEKHRDRIFQPYFTTRTSDRRGMGLSICRDIVAGFKGEIHLDPAVEKGARFRLWLPVPDESPAPKPTSRPPLHPMRGRILVVDDEAPIRNVLQRILGRDHEVVQAASGREAQALLERDPSFDLIMLDLMMPDLSGIDLHRWLALRAPMLARRVVFVTGGAFTHQGNEYLSQVDNPQVDKPFDTAGLRELISGLLETWRPG